MKAKLVVPIFGFSAAALLLAFLRFGGHQALPHFWLKDGAEFRVFQITYNAQPCAWTDHNIGAAKGRLWLYRQLPATLQSRVPEPSNGIGYRASSQPVLSIWWAWVDPVTHQPELGDAGDVLMTQDGGAETNLGWPSPTDEGYRQIFIINPPKNSERLSFKVPVENQSVQFTIHNPAYAP